MYAAHPAYKQNCVNLQYLSVQDGLSESLSESEYKQYSREKISYKQGFENWLIFCMQTITHVEHSQF